jgi:hypothetical protein
MYIVFVRNWWRVESGRLVPNPGARRTRIATAETYDGARELCKQYNDTHAPGKLSRKAEFTDANNY